MTFDKFVIAVFIFMAVIDFLAAFIFKFTDKVDLAIWYALWGFINIWIIRELSR